MIRRASKLRGEAININKRNAWRGETKNKIRRNGRYAFGIASLCNRKKVITKDIT